MAHNVWQILSTSFTVSCVSITIILSGFWTYKFTLDEHLCSVEFKAYHDSKEVVHPSMSMCWQNPFTSSKESGFVNTSEIQNYFSGKGNIERLHMDYENISFQITDYLKKYWVLWRNGSTTWYKPHEYLWNAPYVSYSGFLRNIFYKCFALELPDNSAQSISILLSNKMFPQGIRTPSFGLMAMFHLPNQILRTDITRRRTWPIRKDQNGYSMRFKVQSVEIFQRRRDCHENWVTYDNDVIQYHLKKVGCRPPYHMLKHNLPLCKTNKQMRDIAIRLSLAINYDYAPPCKSMEVVHYQYREAELSGLNAKYTGHFWSGLHIETTHYKVIIQ